MTTAALQRTVRRCTALVVAILGLGFDGLSPGFEGGPLVAGALLYLAVSGLTGLRSGFVEESDDGDGPGRDDPGADTDLP